MDDPNEENIDNNWVIVDSVDDDAVEAIAFRHDPTSSSDVSEEDEYKVTYKDARNVDESTRDKPKTNEQQQQIRGAAESDLDSDGISVISESSPLYEDPDKEESDGDRGENEEEEVEEEEEEEEEVGENSFLPEMSDRMQSLLEEENVGTIEGTSDLLNFYLNCTQKSELETPDAELNLGCFQLEHIQDIVRSDAQPEEPENPILDTRSVRETKYRLPTTRKFQYWIKKYSNRLLIGTVVLAVSSMFLGFFIPDQDELPSYREENLMEFQDQQDNFYEEGGNFEVPSALTYCREQHKTDGMFSDRNAQRCLKKIEKRVKRKKENEAIKENMKNLGDQLRMKENFLNNKEKYLAKKEYELGVKESILKNRKFESEQKSDKASELKLKSKQKDGKRRYNEEYKNSYKNKDDDQFQKYQTDKDDSSKYKKPKNDDFNNKNYKEYKKKFPGNDPKPPFPSKFEECNSKKTKCCHAKSKQKHKILDKDNNTVSGDWVDKMYKARSDLRTKDNSGEWYFDRVSYRKRKRDKAKWYFDWMMDREVMRYKRTFIY